VSAATVIAAAIHERQRLSFFYDGHARVVEPHTFGVDRHGREMLCGYQTTGASTSGKPVGWKFFLIAKISGLHPTEEQFAMPRPEYQRNDGAFLRIIAQL
jgi:predicted DNA-binding transcriptional regulator YafY